MKTFAAIVTKHKAAKHRIPPGQGWKTRQQVARELGVNPRDLREHLADAIAAKDIEEKKFTEWDAAAMKAIPVTCYRIVEKPEPKSPTNAKIIIVKPEQKPATIGNAATPNIPPDLLPRVRALIARHPGKRPSQIADLMRSPRHPRLRAADIAPLMPT